MIGEAIRRFVDRHHLRPCRILVACSGGVDSTALLLAMADLRSDGFAVTCGHVNHHLRAEESDEDERFVRGLAQTLGVDFLAADGTLDPLIIRRSGLEAAAREVRHQRLEEMRAASRSEFIATAHQKNDQAETIVMRMSSGTGLAGLRGIHPFREDRVIRPLLEVSRVEIHAYLRERNVVPRTDRTNADPRFLRNRVRSLLASMPPKEIDDLAHVAERAGELWAQFETMLDAAEKGVVIAEPDRTRFLSVPADKTLRRALLHRHIRRLDPGARDVSSNDLARLAEALDAPARTTVTKNLELFRAGEETHLRRIDRAKRTADFEVPISPGTTRYIPEIDTSVTLREVRWSAAPPGGAKTPVGTPAPHGVAQIFSLPVGHETSAFILRNRRSGDRFQPLGMPRDKKLKDFLIDRKIDAALRDRIPLLIWNGEIVWVGGIEVSERFKVTSATDSLYEVMLEHGVQDQRDHQR